VAVTWNAGTVALIVTNIALIVGWVVSGTQRVAEDLVKARRDKYLALLSTVEKARREGAVADLRQCVTEAEFVATDQMIDSGLIERLALAQSANDSIWAEARAGFLVAARHEAQNNQAFRRRFRRKTLYGESPQTRR